MITNIDIAPSYNSVDMDNMRELSHRAFNYAGRLTKRRRICSCAICRERVQIFNSFLVSILYYYSSTPNRHGDSDSGSQTARKQKKCLIVR